MNSETFVKYLNNPAKLYQLPYEELKTLVLRYPWCQNLRLLLLKKSKQDSHEEYERNLHLAALYSVDRTHLYQQLKDSQLVEASSEESFLLQDEFLELKNLQEIDTEVRGELIEVKTPIAEEELPFVQKVKESEEPNLEPLDFSTLNDDKVEELEESANDALISEILAAGAAGMAAESLTDEKPTFAQEKNIQEVSEDLEEEIDLDLDELLEPTGEALADSPNEDLISDLNLEEWLEPDNVGGKQVNPVEPEAGSEPQIIDAEGVLDDLEDNPDDVSEENNIHLEGEIASASNDSLEEEALVEPADPLLASIDDIFEEDIIGNAASTENQDLADGLMLSEEELLNDVDDLLGYEETGSAASEEHLELPIADTSEKDNLAKVLEEEQEYNDAVEEVGEEQEEIIAEAASASFIPRDKIDQEMTSLLNEFEEAMPSEEPSGTVEVNAIQNELEMELPEEPVLAEEALISSEKVDSEWSEKTVLEQELEIPVVADTVPAETEAIEEVATDDFLADIDNLLEETPESILMNNNEELGADDLLENIEEDFVSVIPEKIPFEIVNIIEKEEEKEEELEDSFPVIDTSAFKARVEASREEIARQEEELRAKAAKKAKKKEKKKKKKKKKKNSEAARIAKQSLQEDEEIGSELLAEILVMQGNDDKAIEMYRRLSLANPEKSAYFAAKIKELEEDEEEEDDL